MLYCSADGSGLLFHLLVNGFSDVLRAVLLTGWQRIAHTSTRQRLSRLFAHHIARLIACWIDYSSARTRLCQLFAHCVARRKVSQLTCGFTQIFCLSMTLLSFYVYRFLTVSLILPLVDVCYPQPVRIPCSSADGSRLHMLALVNSFHNGLSAVLHSGWRGGLLVRSLVNVFYDRLRAVFLRGWQRITRSSTREQFSRWIARRIAQRMAQLIARSFACQRLSRWFTRRVAHSILADSSYFRLSMTFTMVYTPYCSVDGSGLLILPLVNGFYGLRAVFLCEWQRIAHSSTH